MTTVPVELQSKLAIGSAHPTLRDALTGLGLFLAAILFYGLLVLRLAQGQYYDYLNLAFDFDPYLVFSLLTETPGQTLGFKHPLMLLLRPIGLALVAVGLPAKIAAGMTMATIGAATVALVWWFMRLIEIRRIDAFLLTLIFALSSTQILTAIIPESYGVSGFAIALLWCVTAARVLGSKGAISQSSFLRYVSGLLVIGATITNVVQAFIAEMMVQSLRGTFIQLIRRTFRFGLILFAWFLLFCLLVWHKEIWDAAHNPLAAARQIWWLQTKGSHSGLTEVAKSFLAFSFVSPVYSYIKLPETTNMRDFREWAFAGYGAVTAIVWLALAAFGALCSFADLRFRPVAIGLALALAFNLIFHLSFQFRGSIFLYAAHAHFLVFALSAGAALFVRDRVLICYGYRTILVSLICLFAMNNVQMAREFVTAFDQPDTTCKAPCL